jgi:hypothetical protein
MAFLWEQNFYFQILRFEFLLELADLGVSGRSRSRSLRSWYGGLQNRYRPSSGYTQRSESCCRDVLVVFPSPDVRIVMRGGKWDWRTESDDKRAFWMEGSKRVVAGLLRIVCGGAGEGEDDRHTVDE